MTSLRKRSWVCEVAYEGNLGFHEMYMFYQKATKKDEREMKRLLDLGIVDKIYDLLERVTGIKLKK